MSIPDMEKAGCKPANSETIKAKQSTGVNYRPVAVFTQAPRRGRQLRRQVPIGKRHLFRRVAMARTYCQAIDAIRVLAAECLRRGQPAAQVAHDLGLLVGVWDRRLEIVAAPVVHAVAVGVWA